MAASAIKDLLLAGAEPLQYEVTLREMPRRYRARTDDDSTYVLPAENKSLTFWPQPLFSLPSVTSIPFGVQSVFGWSAKEPSVRALESSEWSRSYHELCGLTFKTLSELTRMFPSVKSVDDGIL